MNGFRSESEHLHSYSRLSTVFTQLYLSNRYMIDFARRNW